MPGKGTQLFRGLERTQRGRGLCRKGLVHVEGRGGTVTRERKGDLSGGCLDFQPAQLLDSFVSVKCDLSLLGATGVKTSRLGWGWRGSGGQSLGLGTLPGPLIQQRLILSHAGYTSSQGAGKSGPVILGFGLCSFSPALLVSTLQSCLGVGLYHSDQRPKVSEY